MLSATAREAATQFGERAVLEHRGRALSYAALDLAADAVAAGMRRDGVGPGDVVAAVLPSGAEWLVLAVAADRIGAAFAPVSTHLSSVERGALIAGLDAGLVVCGPDLTDGLPLRAAVRVVDDGGLGEELSGPDSPSIEPVDGIDDPERVAMICFTSGTTGRARGATFRIRQLQAVSEIDLGDRRGNWGGGEHLLASTHFAHVGMALKLPWYLRTGSTLCVLDRWRADDALELVARHRMSTLGVVAPQLALMLRSTLMDELDLSCVERIIAGGAASPPALVTEARRRFGAGYSIRYSSTESGGVGLATAYDADDEEALATVGRPRPGIEVRVVRDDGDDAGADLGIGETGELQLRSPAMMDGYWLDVDATTEAFTGDGWLRTGDLAHHDDRGCIVLDGRRTDMFIRGGYNVFPSEVEAVLGQHPHVDAVAIVPRADDVLGEIGVAVVVAVDGSAPTLESLREFAAESLARHKLPEAIEFIDELPLTAGAKLDRAALRAGVDAATAPESAP